MKLMDNLNELQLINGCKRRCANTVIPNAIGFAGLDHCHGFICVDLKLIQLQQQLTTIIYRVIDL